MQNNPIRYVDLHCVQLNNKALGVKCGQGLPRWVRTACSGERRELPLHGDFSFLKLGSGSWKLLNYSLSFVVCF